MAVEIYSKDETKFRVTFVFGSSDPAKEDDTRLLSIDNPIAGLSLADVNALYTAGASVLIGDRDGDPLSTYKDPEIVETTTTWADYKAPTP